MNFERAVERLGYFGRSVESNYSLLAVNVSHWK